MDVIEKNPPERRLQLRHLLRSRDAIGVALNPSQVLVVVAHGIVHFT
jgi:hypothetical protein